MCASVNEQLMHTLISLLNLYSQHIHTLPGKMQDCVNPGNPSAALPHKKCFINYLKLEMHLFILHFLLQVIP